LCDGDQGPPGHTISRAERRTPSWAAKHTPHQLCSDLISSPAHHHGEGSPRYGPHSPRLRKLTYGTGTLVKCDPSIKALILNIDKESGNRYVIEDLGDEEHLLVKNDQIHELKRRVQEARFLVRGLELPANASQEISRRIDTRKDEEEE
jgi:TFIIH basal transcription factor complex TTD-A subunit